MTALDPTKPLTTPADALATAGALLHSPRDGRACGSIWSSVAEAPLAPMLYAALRVATAKAAVGWCWPWTTCKKTTEIATRRAGTAGARYVAGHPLFGNALLHTVDMDRRQRDSIVMTMRDALSPWMRPRKESTGE
jgi:type IV secretion system protein VirD4